MEELVSLFYDYFKSLPEYRGFDDELLGKFIREELMACPVRKNKLANDYERFVSGSNASRINRNANFKFFYKCIKRKLNEVYETFYVVSMEKRERVFRDLLDNDGDLDAVLRTHKSVAERYDDYENIYESLLRFLNMDSYDTIVDLGSGYNPLVMGRYFSDKEYIFADLNEDDIKFIEKVLRYYRVDCKGICIDLVSERQKLKESLENLGEKNVVCFMLKLLDSLETIKKNSSLELIKELIRAGINSFVISFSKMGLNGQVINFRRRSWFINFIEKNTEFNFSYDYFETETEVFFLLEVQ